MSAESESHSFSESKEKYRKVVRVVYHQTSKKQPPLSPLSVIYITATSENGMDTNEVRKKLKMGVEEKKHLMCIDGKVGVRFDPDRIQRIITYVAKNGLGETIVEDGVKKNSLIAELNTIRENVKGAEFKHLKYK